MILEMGKIKLNVDFQLPCQSGLQGMKSNFFD